MGLLTDSYLFELATCLVVLLGNANIFVRMVRAFFRKTEVFLTEAQAFLSWAGHGILPYGPLTVEGSLFSPNRAE